MTRFVTALFAGVLLLPVASARDARFAKVIYGETTAFWETHTLVEATVVSDRFEDDGKSLVTSDHLQLRVEESIPARMEAGARVAMTVTLLLGSVRDRPQGLQPHFHVGDRVLVLLENGKPIPASPDEFVSFAMMPGGSDWYRVTGKDDPLATKTKWLCRAISEPGVGKRLALIEAILKDRPDERVRDVLKRRLEVTLAEAKREVEEAKRLLEEAGKK